MGRKEGRKGWQISYQIDSKTGRWYSVLEYFGQHGGLERSIFINPIRKYQSQKHGKRDCPFVKADFESAAKAPRKKRICPERCPVFFRSNEFLSPGFFIDKSGCAVFYPGRSIMDTVNTCSVSQGLALCGNVGIYIEKVNNFRKGW
jgi:hypothetical protein